MQSMPKFKNADDFRVKKTRNETKTMFPLTSFFMNKYAITAVNYLTDTIFNSFHFTPMMDSSHLSYRHFM